MPSMRQLDEKIFREEYDLDKDGKLNKVSNVVNILNFWSLSRVVIVKVEKDSLVLKEIPKLSRTFRKEKRDTIRTLIIYSYI